MQRFTLAADAVMAAIEEPAQVDVPGDETVRARSGVNAGGAPH